MSKQAYDDFMKQLQGDTALQREMKEQLKTLEEGVPASEVANFAAAKGYQFSVEDISGELDEEALNAVAGGLSYLNIGTIQLDTYYKVDSLYLKFDGLSYKW